MKQGHGYRTWIRPETDIATQNIQKNWIRGHGDMTVCEQRVTESTIYNTHQ